MKYLLVIAGLVAGSFAVSTSKAQTPNQPVMNYNYAELRFVDVDVAGGDGFRLGGSYELDNNWLIVGSLTTLDFNNDVDSFTIDIGAGYVWPWQEDWDLVATLRFQNTDVDTPFGSDDDSGVAVSGGVRGLITPEFEVRGAVSHVTVGDNDTFIEIAGDYYFAPQFAAGLSVDVLGDVDTFTIGARWFFR